MFLHQRARMLSGGLLPGRDRRTCHWCGKDANHRAAPQASRYCANVFCDKNTGQAQFVCGACYRKQAEYWAQRQVDVRNVFGMSKPSAGPAESAIQLCHQHVP
jgi:hypothetical protein